MKKKNLSNIAVLLLVVVLLAACGGGDAPVEDVTGKKWGTAELIETGTESAYDPQVVMDSGGNAIAVWRQSDGGVHSIWTNRYTVGTGWGTAELIETENSTGASDPRLDMDSDGNAMAVWSQGSSIMANRYVAGTGWGTAELIETGFERARCPQVAMNSSGNAIAVWMQGDGSWDSIWANRYVAGTGWGTAELIETSSTSLDYGAMLPQVAMDASGNALAVWSQYEGTNDSIWSNRYVAGTGWGTAELIETDNSGNAYRPQLAMDSAGNAMAVWGVMWPVDGTVDSIWANRYSAGTGWDTAEPIETGSGDAGYPQVTVDSAGNAMAIWHQFDGVRSSIWANRFE